MHPHPMTPTPSRRVINPWLGGLLLATVLTAAVANFSPVDAQQRAVEIPTPGDDLYEVRLADGSELVARVNAVEGDMVVLTTTGGSRVEVRHDQIRRIRPVRGRFVDGEFWGEDPNATRLFFTSTGRSLRRGEAYVGSYMIVLPFVAVGITDRLTLAAGAPVLFGEFEPFYVAPKLQLMDAPSVKISTGVLAFFFQDEVVGITYGVGTFGSPDRAFTAGLGFGFSGADFASEPVAMVGGETRLSRGVKLITENYFLPGETGAVFSGGIRFIGDRLSTDVGAFGASGDGDAGCCLPMLTFSYAFGRGR